MLSEVLLVRGTLRIWAGNSKGLESPGTQIHSFRLPLVWAWEDVCIASAFTLIDIKITPSCFKITEFGSAREVHKSSFNYFVKYASIKIIDPGLIVSGQHRTIVIAYLILGSCFIPGDGD